MITLLRTAVDFGFSHPVALRFGIPAALVLNRIAWSINYHAENGDKWRDKYYREDRWWMDNTFDAIVSHFRGLISLATVKRSIAALEESGVLIGKKMGADRWDHTKWYAIDTAKYATLLSGADQLKMSPSSDDSIKMSQSSLDQNDPIQSVGMRRSSYSNSPSNSRTKSPPSSSSKPTAVKYQSEDLALGREWLDFALKEKGGVAYVSWSPEKFAEEMAKIRKKTDLNHFGLRAIFEFIKIDDFWRPNAISPAGLLTKSKNGLLKIENIIAGMKGAKQYKENKPLKPLEEKEPVF